MTYPGQPEITGYKALAGRLREQISNNTYPPGWRLPSEQTLAQTYGINRETVRRAIRELRAEGLVVVTRGRGVLVRKPEDLLEVTPEPGSVVWARNPTPDERSEYDVPEGVPLLVVTAPDGIMDLYPANRVRLRWPD